MTEGQYMRLGWILNVKVPCNLLVFGLGDDSYAWDTLNKNGKTIFIEDDTEWSKKFKTSNLDIINVTYDTNVANHESIGFDKNILSMNLPERVRNTDWDFIIVDAPLGHGPPGRPYKGPGRMQSIYEAYNLLKPGGICAIDDFGRHVEQKYGFHYFKKENLIDAVEGKVAFFKKVQEKKPNVKNKETKNNTIDSLRKYVEGKSVALVGPAKYMMSKNFGEEIDNHDIVVRINRGIESIDAYPDNLGIRTDLYYSCLIERAQQTGILCPDSLKNKHKIKFLIAPPKSDIKGRAYSNQLHEMVDKEKVDRINELIPVNIVDHKFHTELANKVLCKPNTGFLSIYHLLSLKPKKLSIYGFSFYLDGFIEGQKSGVEIEKNCTEQEFSELAYNSKRHIQKNMWKYAKETILKNDIVSLDPILKQILQLDKLDKKIFREKVKV